jgi:septum formation protein
VLTPTLLLASTSPRRYDLLTRFGYKFEVLVHPVEELAEPTLDPAALVTWNARIKALPVATQHPDRLVIGADTVVAFGERVLGKPASMEDAAQMLSELNGREHAVYSGVCLAHKAAGIETVFVERTLVRFHTLTPPQQAAYLARIKPLDKAGAYAAQDDNGELIAGFEGSFTNVIGLPMETLSAHLAKMGVNPIRPEA